MIALSVAWREHLVLALTLLAGVGSLLLLRWWGNPPSPLQVIQRDKRRRG